MAHANNAGMSHVADCIYDLEDKPDSLFKAEEVDVSSCISKVIVQIKDTANGSCMVDVNRNAVLKDLQTITIISKFETAKELRKHRTRKKEDKRQKFFQDKLLLHGIIMGQIDPSVKQQLNNLDKYKLIKKGNDLIKTMKWLHNICYANKDGGLTSKPYSNLEFKMKHLNFRMKQHQSGSYFKELVKVNYQYSLSVGRLFPFGTASITTNLKEDGIIWDNYLVMSVDNRKAAEKKLQDLDESILFILGCNSYAMQTDLK